MEPARSPVESFSLAPGDGLVARRTTAALFIPGADDHQLVKRFTEAPDDRTAMMLVCHAAGGPASAVTLAAVGWAPTRIVVCGELDVRLQSDVQDAVVSGRSSTTWIEHSPSTAMALTISAGDTRADPTTQLGIGSVRAGGFAVSLSAGASEALGVEPTTDRAPAVVTDPPQVPANTQLSASTRQAPRIELGRSGRTLSLEQPVLIGRGPDIGAFPEADGLVPILIDDLKLSRNHLIVSWVDGAVAVTDCDSTNGTIIVDEPGARPQALAPHDPLRIDYETVVYLGDETIRLSRRSG